MIRNVILLPADCVKLRLSQYILRRSPKEDIVIRSELLQWHNPKVTNGSVLYFHVGYASMKRPYEWHLIRLTACPFAPNAPATVVRGSKARMSMVSYANSALAILPAINR